VTSFFRDPEAFPGAGAAGIIPAALCRQARRRRGPRLGRGLLHRRGGLFDRHPAAGAHGGAEAELHGAGLRHRHRQPAIATARAGLYPASIAADVSPERLARFFAPSRWQSYRIHKSIRDMLVFSEQDVIKDPPFSKLDLISCRNLLIYLGRSCRRKLIPLFHYALNPGGVLFLGTSEGIGDLPTCLPCWTARPSCTSARTGFAGAHARRAWAVSMPLAVAAMLPPPRTARRPGRETAAARTDRTGPAAAVAPAGALVNGQGDILYLHGRTGLYLEPAPGEAGVNNILKMAREGLRPGLTAALHKAESTRSRALPGAARQDQRHFPRQPDRPSGPAAGPAAVDAAAPCTW
jgi:two-component system CheB/CheR fusion protein